MDADNTATLLQISQILYGWGSLIIFFIGTFGNILDIILFIRLESLNTLASSLFLLASFIGSQCVMLTATLLRVIFGLTGYDPLFSSLFLCKARWMVGPASGAFSLTCVSLAAADRYIVVRSQYRTKITLNQARLAIILAAIFWLGFFSIYAMFFVAPTSDSCRLVNSIMIQLMPFISFFVYSVIPIVVLSVLCRLIWHTLGQLPLTYLHGGNRLHDQVTRMIIAQIIVVIVTSLPTAVYSVYTISTRTVIKSSRRLAIETLVNTVCVLIGFLTHAIMFYVYLIASTSFHQNVKTMFRVGVQRIALLFPQLFVNRQVIVPAV
ncbi:unnamed protein product [Rotaria sp. Silwood2]|nr:unnamed protein product [Rotaria sp. Silwood2]CAF3113121.1 unnamed protein product [Rotaria sp. Silwood2]CAF3368703.1 unnamed protein product [Rotaria sp. Silwood2]CAF4119688.1 unnamed protein product [Rotaria sp. Silwood2]CAF4352843.1 unnamed protein product [Rotaria sp. Silwood2]